MEFEIKDIPIVGSTTKTLDSYGIEYGVAAFIIGVLVLIFGLNAVGISQSRVITFAVALAPLWLPYAAFHLFFEKWMEMVQKQFTIKQGRAIFEIVLPPEVFKSPEAMEFVLTQLYNPANPDNLMETYRDGKKPLPYTFEIVSKGGDVRFYMTTPGKAANAVIDNMYAQYPGVEVRQLDLDYTAALPMDPKNLSFMSFHFGKKKDKVFPIKTYIDFEMDRLPKEEQKVDPMTPMLEVMAGIRPEQEIWVQFVCVAHKDKNFKLGSLHSKGTWEKDIAAAIDKIMQRDNKTKAGPADMLAFPRLTTGEQDLVKRMERNGAKYAFDFAARFLYISHKQGDFDGGLFSRFIRSLAQTELKNSNGLGVRWRTDFDYKMFSDPFGKKVPALKKAELKEYKLRKLETKGHSGVWSVISVEELATIFHLPGTVARTPTLNRVTSTRGEAPANLPISQP